MRKPSLYWARPRFDAAGRHVRGIEARPYPMLELQRVWLAR